MAQADGEDAEGSRRSRGRGRRRPPTWEISDSDAENPTATKVGAEAPRAPRERRAPTKPPRSDQVPRRLAVCVDPAILEDAGSDILMEALGALDCECRIEPQPLARSLQWSPGTPDLDAQCIPWEARAEDKREQLLLLEPQEFLQGVAQLTQVPGEARPSLSSVTDFPVRGGLGLLSGERHREVESAVRGLWRVLHTNTHRGPGHKLARGTWSSRVRSVHAGTHWATARLKGITAWLSAQTSVGRKTIPKPFWMPVFRACAAWALAVGQVGYRYRQKLLGTEALAGQGRNLQASSHRGGYSCFQIAGPPCCLPWLSPENPARPHLAVIGLDAYLWCRQPRTQKSWQPEKSKETQANMAVSWPEVEEGLVLLQLCANLDVLLVASWQELSQHVCAFTKALSQSPSRQFRDSQAFSFCTAGRWASGSRVARDGSGLRGVWWRQIQQFNRVSPAVADAVVATFPSPRLLQQALMACGTEQERLGLLADLPVKASGDRKPRRVGPDLSRRICLFLTSTNPDLLLDLGF